MKTTCPNCQKTMDNSSIKVLRKNGLHLEKQCPHCQNWFRLIPLLMLLKTFGILLLLVGSMLNILTIKPEFSTLFSLIGFVGILVAVIITIKGKQQLLEK